MRVASKVLFLVGAIVSIVSAVFLVAYGVFAVVFPSLPAFQEMCEQMAVDAPGSTTEHFVKVMTTVFITLGICSFIEAACAAVSSVVAFKAHATDRPSTALNVLNIVFSVLGGVVVNAVGGIFGLIANAHDERVIENK